VFLADFDDYAKCLFCSITEYHYPEHHGQSIYYPTNQSICLPFNRLSLKTLDQLLQQEQSPP
jgi:hypothetical protein